MPLISERTTGASGVPEGMESATPTPALKIYTNINVLVVP
jgi:hypothetical protein